MAFTEDGKWVPDDGIVYYEMKKLREDHRAKFKFLQDEKEDKKED